MQPPRQPLDDRRPLAAVLKQPRDPALGVRVPEAQPREALGLVVGHHGEDRAKVYVTFSYKDAESKDQAVVFEFDKDDIRPTLAILKARTGKEITYQHEEARKQMGGGGEKK